MRREMEGIDPRKIERAKQLLGFESGAEAIEVALDLLVLDDAYLHRLAGATVASVPDPSTAAGSGHASTTGLRPMEPGVPTSG